MSKILVSNAGFRTHLRFPRPSRAGGRGAEAELQRAVLLPPHWHDLRYALSRFVDANQPSLAQKRKGTGVSLSGDFPAPADPRLLALEPRPVTNL